ncbi:MAG: glycosyltransferase [Rhodanobacter denitrificans]|uniref:Glycosyltransferase n=1 Tax=Rhodanobacter denitrificans TaxID=666685 RepID=A0A2W5MM20_9GAMM|nr:MAG: glycosyltransferase [Rhodanobacter denitrificans]
MSEPAARSRIAVLLPDLRPGGAERMSITLAQVWLARGCDVDFVVMRDEGALRDALPERARLVVLGAPRIRGALVPLRRYLRRTRPDALLAAMWPLTVAAVIAARSLVPAVRVVVSDHTLLSEAYKDRGRLHRLALRMSTALSYRLAAARIAVSAGVAADLSRLSGLPVRRFEVIHNPLAGRIDEEARGDTASVPTRRRAGPLILTVGTLKAVKDHILLIDAFARLPERLNATLCIVGDGPLRGQLERHVRDCGLSGRVSLAGFSADPTGWYRQADVFVLSSRHEGFGNVIVEALAQGVPVVSTDCPSGPREILAGGRHGRLVRMGDPEALAAAILDTLQTPHDRAALIARARDFLPERIGAAYLRLLLPEAREAPA